MQIQELPQVNVILKKEYETHKAPIIDLMRAGAHDPFHILVATILSARTKDETTSAVCARLFEVVNSPHDFDKLNLKKLEKLIYPIGFFHTKAKHLKQLPAALDEYFSGRVPDEIDDLIKLPGVGRKTANLVRAQAFDKPAICVDVHVHRICNRLGLIKTADPFETEMKLREILPEIYWITWNSYLVSFGQTTCKPIGPICNKCPIFKFCKRVDVKTKHL